MKATVAILFISAQAFANDGAAKATPAGGIQLTREARISMEKERLTIGKDRVSVEYKFLNTSDRDITTEVAFPTPAFDISSYFTSGPYELKGWHVWVEGKELKYDTETKATLKGIDHSAILRKFGIDIASFGHFDEAPDGKITHDGLKLPLAQQSELRKLGLFEDDLPRWTVLKTYHWTQLFPAHKILHVRHEYAPELGMEHLDQKAIQNDGFEDHAKLSDSCVDPGVRRRLIAAAPRNHGLLGEGFISPVWVDYILTTANTWKTPIKDFELIIERPKPDAHAQYYVSLCWDGKLEKRGTGTFVAKLQNFIPKQELRVMFIAVGN